MPLLALARLLKLPQSAVLFVGGLASTLLPGLLPAVRVDPEVVLGLLSRRCSMPVPPRSRSICCVMRSGGACSAGRPW
jgi:hypothetical protein